jgi:hypothetical protein
MTSLAVRRFLIVMVVIALTLSMGAFAIPAIQVQASSTPNAMLNFGTYFGSNVSGDSITNTVIPR